MNRMRRTCGLLDSVVGEKKGPRRTAIVLVTLVRLCLATAH